VTVLPTARIHSEMRRLLLATSALVFVLTACGGGQRVPKGVTEIDIHSPGPLHLSTHRSHGHVYLSPGHHSPVIVRRVTDPSQVTRITAWFNSLRPPAKVSYACAGGPAETVRFTFRSVNGDALATAYSAPLRAGPCDTIGFIVGEQREGETFLTDSSHGPSLIHRVQRLLGVKFPDDLYLG
jgi:hypothetical protein